MNKCSDKINLKNQILALLLIFTIAFGFIPEATWAAENVKEIENSPQAQAEIESKLDWVYIFYDPTDENMKYIGESVSKILKTRLYNVALISIGGESDLDRRLNDNPWMAIYAFNANMDSIKLSNQNLEWKDFYRILASHRDTQHIVGTPNTFSFEDAMNEPQDFIYDSETEQTDVDLLLMYDIWAVSEIANQRAQIEPTYNSTANDIRAMALTMFADNVNYFINIQFEPKKPIGQVNEQARSARTQEMWDRHTPQIRPAAYRKDENGTLVEIPKDEIPDDFSPTIKLSPKAAVGEDDFSLGDIPLFSGLRGPIGDIVDVLLDLLTSTGNNALSIPKEVMNNIKEAFKYITKIVGIVKDFDSESPLKSLLDTLADEFPFMETMKPFLEIFTKALFNFRGTQEDIQEIIMELVNALIETVLPDSVGGIITQVLNIGPDLMDTINDVVSGGKSIFDAMVGFFTSNVMEGILNKTLVATLGISQSQVTSLINKFLPMVKSTINFLVSFDVEDLISALTGPVLEAAIGTLSGSANDAVKKVGSILKLGFNVIDMIDSFSNESVYNVVKGVMVDIIGAPNFQGDYQNLTKKIMKIVQNFKEGSFTDINKFKDYIRNLLLNGLKSSVSTETRELIIDIMAMVTGIFNKGFDPAQLPDIFSLVTRLLDVVGLDTSTKDTINGAINGILKPVLGIIGSLTKSDGLKQLLPSELTSYSSIMEALPDLLEQFLNYLDTEGLFDELPNFQSVISNFGEIAGGIMNIVQSVRGKSFTGVLKSIWVAVGGVIGIAPAFDDVPIDALLTLMKTFFPDAFGISRDNIPDPTETISQIMTYASGHLGLGIDENTLQSFLSIAMDFKGLFTDGLDWIVGKVLDWLGGLLQPILDDLEKSINEALGGDNELLGYHNKIPLGLGQWSLFDLDVDLGIQANFHIDPTPLFDLIKSLILDGRSTFSLDSPEDFFKTFFSFFEISPQFYASLGVSGMDSGKNSFMQYLLESLGLELSFSGHAKFVLNLFTFRGGIFEWDQFLNVVAWEFSIKIELGKTFTLLDFLTGGVGGGALNAVMEFLGLDSINVRVYISVELEIVKKAATASAPEVSTLTIVITLGVTLTIPIDLYIVSITIIGTMEIILTFFQDLASSAPMKITLKLVLTLKVKLKFLFISKTFTWTWQPGGPWDLSPHKGEDEYDDSGIGFDSDGDGLGDEYEATLPGYLLNKTDTDDDGASDKLEIQTMGTDGTNPDTDGDGLLDGEEWNLGTNPLRQDSDYDKLTDYEEVKIYHTDPLCQDTDGDQLSDFYEVFHHWNLTGVTPTVEEVIIGGESYNDHTDPLNPDTDGDGLYDGEEGPMGAYYGLDALYNESAPGVDDDPLIFFNGYTCPLDADTDDDSYLQLYNGQIDSQALMFLKDMNDGAEVKGFTIIVYDEEGEPEWKHVFTNPCNPDTDGDTGMPDHTPQPGMWINSDGYELAQTPPTDPTNGDSDGDGLIDGIEGVLNPYSNHTNPNDPDTDDDGLFDMQEILLHTDPRSPDTDLDMIPDGDEFYIFHTSPLLFDTDFDGLGDGEEVYFWHSNPNSDDSDGDRILDGVEVLKYGSDPMDEDGDNDGVSDFEEIMVYGTNPFDYDSDADGLSDGDELFTFNTDPLNWDTDFDSILEPNADGLMTWSMNDYDEVMIYGTDPTMPDTDLDGLSDSLELYIASGQIPWLNGSIALNPMNNDTDGDGFKDSIEMRVLNITQILYPFTANSLLFPYNTRPDMNDTDNDGVNDYIEVIDFNCDPTSNDSDNDTITDYDEIYVYGTSPTSNDTDGDGLMDNEELLVPMGSAPESGGPQASSEIFKPKSSATYNTDPLNWDSDGDWLPDGAEIHFYGTDPMDDDSDFIPDGVKDGDEFDTDYDGLSDGEEFRLGLQTTAGGGIMNPDSDYDGLLDGDEVYIFGTLANNSDTDGDSYSDGIELTVGTDPLVWTSADQFNMALAQFHGDTTIVIMLPRSAKNVYQNTPVIVANLTTFQDMWYRYKNENSTYWSENLSLAYSDKAQEWQDKNATWDAGPNEIQVFGRDLNGSINMAYAQFSVKSGNAPNWALIGGAGGGGSLLLGIAIFILIMKKKKGGK